MDQQTFFAINSDSTINFFKPKQGEWLGLKANVSYDEVGSGCVSAQIFDEHGPIGFSSQTVLIRGGAPMHVKENNSQK